MGILNKVEGGKKKTKQNKALEEKLSQGKSFTCEGPTRPYHTGTVLIIEISSPLFL